MTAPLFRDPLRSAGVICFPLLLWLSCSESLPPYQDPSKLFEGSIDAVYLFNVDQNEMNVVLRVRNIFDEQLDGQALISGQVEITSIRDPGVHKTVPLSSNYLVAGRYNRQTGRLVLDPGEEIRFEIPWDFVDDGGRNLRTSFFVMLKDTTCPFRCLGFREDFRLAAQVNLYARTSAAPIGPTIFSLWYVSAAIDVQVCPPLGPASLRTLQLPPCGS